MNEKTDLGTVPGVVYNQQPNYSEGNGDTSTHPQGPPPNPQTHGSVPGQHSYDGIHQPGLTYPADKSMIMGGQRPSNYGTGISSVNCNSNHQDRSNATIPPPMGAPPPGLQNNSSFRGKKSLVDTYLLAVPFGFIGAHHFYLQRYRWAILYFFTFGLLGCGYVIDLFRIPYLVRKYNREHQPNNYNNNVDPQCTKKKKDLSDAYVAWFPFGLIGFHHYYLGNYGLGILFTMTFGVFGLGWLIDGFRMPFLVKEANNREQMIMPNSIKLKKLGICYLLALPPLGWLGLHHFYMNRPFYGYTYVLSLGQIGMGWLVDLFRMPVLLSRCNAELMLTRKLDVKTKDDCYVLWFPCGLLGFHHYYLGRFGWGLLYTFTLGLFGIGWLVDFVRIPWLVSEANRNRDEMEEQLVADLKGSASETPSFHSLSFHPNVQPSYNSYSNYPSAPTSNQFDNSSNDVMRLPGNGTSCVPDTTTVLTPPAYSFNDANSQGNYNAQNHTMQSSPPPYKE